MQGIGTVNRVWQCARLLGAERRRVLAAASADAATLDLLSVLRLAGPPYQLDHPRAPPNALSSLRVPSRSE